MLSVVGPSLTEWKHDPVVADVAHPLHRLDSAGSVYGQVQRSECLNTMVSASGDDHLLEPPGLFEPRRCEWIR